MKALKIDENGDFVMENGSFVMVEGDEQLAQEVRIAIQTNRGEWFLDLDEGLDREPIFAKNFNENNARSSIIESLMNTSEPLAVEEIDFLKVGRVLYVNLVLRKEDGSILNVEDVRV